MSGRRWASTVIRWLGLLLLVALAACGKDNQGGGKATATVSRPDAAQLLQEAATRTESLPSFRFLLEHEKGASPIVLGLTMSRAEGDVAKPEQLRADVDASFGGVNLKLKLVSIGPSARITNPFNPNQWQDLPTGTKVSDVFDPGAGTTAALRGMKDPKITGEETIGGVKTWKIEGTVDAASLSALATLAEPGYTAGATVWVGQETPNVHRIRLDGPLGSRDANPVVRVITLSRFGESITITPPPSN